jgi:hypothetical protein
VDAAPADPAPVEAAPADTPPADTTAPADTAAAAPSDTAASADTKSATDKPAEKTPVVTLDVAYGATAVANPLTTSPIDPGTLGTPRVASAVSASASIPSAAKESAKLYASAVAGSLDPLESTGAWSTFGSAAGRFGPWVALLGLAFIMEAVARSAMRDRLRTRTVKPS